MALKGNLSNFRLGDVLQTLTQNQTWGVLRLERVTERRDLVVSPYGVAILNLADVARERLVERLEHCGVLDESALAFLRARENARKPLTELLAQIPSVDPAAVRAALEAEAGEVVQGLLEWKEGTFELLEGEAPSDSMAGLTPRDTSGLVFEAARRQDERAAFGEAFPHEEERYRAVPLETALDLTQEEKTLLDALGGDDSLRAIADRTTGDFFATAKLILSLESRGLVRRLEWRELLEVVAHENTAGRPRKAAAILRFLESWPQTTDPASFLELGTFWRDTGDDSGAARCCAKAAELYAAANSHSDALERAAACMAEAVALAPKDPAYRARRFELAQSIDGLPEETLYDLVRDWLVVCADRGDATHAERIEAEILPRIPPSSDEEARVARALGQLGRKVAACQLLCRAAKRRLMVKGEESKAATEFQDALRFAPNDPDAEKGLAKLDARRAGRRRATVVAVTAIVGLTVAVAFPVRSSWRSREEAKTVAQAESLLERGEAAAALQYLDMHEARITAGELLEKCQGIRERATKLCDERRQREQGEADVWTREQFARAANAIDGRDYATAASIYAAILDRGFDEAKLQLVHQRLSMIESRLALERKRVEDLCRSLASRSGSALKAAVLNSPAARQELESLVARPRREGLAALAASIGTSSLANALAPEERKQLLSTLTAANETFARGADVHEWLSRQQADAEELNDLENVLLAARAFEAEGDAASAREAFELLGSRYKGTALRKYFDDRILHWRRVCQALEAHEQALAVGETELAREHLEKARSLCPNVRVKVVDSTFEVRSLPAGARLFVDGRDMGTCPVKIKIPSGKRAQLEARLEGFETSALSSDRLTSGKVVLELPPRPAWTVELGSAPSGPGIVTTEGLWVLGDRRGVVRAIDATGSVRWSVSLPTLSGICGSPVRSGDLLYVATLEGLVVSLHGPSGLERGRCTLPTPIASAPEPASGGVAVLGTNNVVYFVGADGRNVSKSFPLFGRATTGLTSSKVGWYVGTADGSVLSLDFHGELRWRSPSGVSVDALRTTPSGACLAISGSTLLRLDAETGAPTNVLALEGACLFEDGAGEAGRLWMAWGSQVKSIDMETLDAGMGFVLAFDDARQFVRLTSGFAIVGGRGIHVLDDYGRPFWSLTGIPKPRVSFQGAPWLGVLDDTGRVSRFTNLP